MTQVLGTPAAIWEPGHYTDAMEVVVDSRCRHNVAEFDRMGHRIVHLVRDGRDVVRSLDRWYQKTASNGLNVKLGKFRWGHLKLSGEDFAACCREWAEAVDMMGNHQRLRIEDLSLPEVRDAQLDLTMPHWTEWDEDMTATFWQICGEQMKRMGYERG